MDQEVLSHTARIVSAHLGNNPVAPDRIPDLIREVYSTLTKLGSEGTAPAAPALIPAVPIKNSVKHDYIICLEDGKPFKMLKRHLATTYNMTPEEYRKRWNLPAAYPMVAPAYADTRSLLAKKSGLGRTDRQNIGGNEEQQQQITQQKITELPTAPIVRQIPEGQRGTARSRRNAA